MPSLSIVIVNWNTRDQLRECLSSLSVPTLPAHWSIEDVVVVDNASTDGSADRLSSPVGRLRIERNERNRGFGAACNQGAAVAGGEALLFLNPDTRLFASSLEAPLTLLGAPERASTGIIGIALEDESGHVARVCARFPRAGHFLAQAVGLDRIHPGSGHLMREWDHLDSRPVDQVIGAFFLVRRSLFDRMEGFDERFFVYFEEVDLALRARRAGFASYYCAEARAFHSGGGSSRQIKGQRLFYVLRSRLQYGAKHFGIVEFGVLLFATLLVEPISRLVQLLLSGRIGEISNLLEGYSLLFRQGLSLRKT